MSVETSPLIGVAIWVLRGQRAGAEVLLLQRAAGSFAGSWCPVAGRLHDGEPEAAGARRELAEETGLAPARFYAAGFAGEGEADDSSAGRIGLFVAFVDEDSAVRLDREHSDFAWLGVEQALARLPLPAQRHALTRVRERFLTRDPDEALRIG